MRRVKNEHINPVVGVALARMRECIGPDIVATYPTHLQLENMTTHGHHITEMLFPCASSRGNDVIRLISSTTHGELYARDLIDSFDTGLDDDMGEWALNTQDMNTCGKAHLIPSPTIYRSHEQHSRGSVGHPKLPLFILGVYTCIHREELEVPRHTVQATLCLILRRPVFVAFIPMITELVNYYARSDCEEEALVKAVYCALHTPGENPKFHPNPLYTFPSVEDSVTNGGDDNINATELSTNISDDNSSRPLLVEVTLHGRCDSSEPPTALNISTQSVREIDPNRFNSEVVACSTSPTSYQTPMHHSHRAASVTPKLSSADETLLSAAPVQFSFELPRSAIGVRSVESVYKLLQREVQMIHLVRSLEARAFMTIWKALAHQRAIVIVGPTADEVSRLVIACVVWANPVRIPLCAIFPYVSSPAVFESNSMILKSKNDTKTPIWSSVVVGTGDTSAPYVIGTTNEFFMSRHILGDVIVNINTGELWVRPEAEAQVTLCPKDLSVAKHLQEGVQDGKDEHWVRLTLERHTRLTLQSLPSLDILRTLSSDGGYLHRLRQWVAVGRRRYWFFGGIALTATVIIVFIVAFRTSNHVDLSKSGDFSLQNDPSTPVLE